LAGHDWFYFELNSWFEWLQRPIYEKPISILIYFLHTFFKPMVSNKNVHI